MLVIKLFADPLQADRIQVEVSRQIDQQNTHIATYIAQGSITTAASHYSSYNLLLNDSFDEETVRLFGRYGIIQLISHQGSTSAPDDIFLSGGQAPDQDLPPNVLRLETEDHRQLLFLVRKIANLRAEVLVQPSFNQHPVMPPSSDSLVSRHLHKLLTVATASLSPFVALASANAQCKTPTNGQNGSASGAGYSAVNQTYIQNQEGGISPGGTSPNGTGYGATYYGLDLGMTSANSLANTFHLPQSTINFFSPLIGKTGSAAVQAYNSNPAFANPPAAIQQQVYANVYPAYFAAAAASFNQLAANKGINFQFSNMPMQWQTVTASMYFQAGPPTASTSSKFMQTQFASQIVNGQYSAAYQNLQNFQSPNVYQNQRAAANAQYLSNDGCTN